MARTKKKAALGKKRTRRSALHLNGELYLELGGIGGFDHATRACVAFPYPVGSIIQITGDYHAKVENYGGKVSNYPSTDVVVIYLNTKDAPDGFTEPDDDTAVGEFIRTLAARGWKCHRVK
ncbi:MAG TPA: hypothetical protein VHD38_03445 [Candidatus Paceibacterota bacterium]|nr:hypothetical protein [Candidatus Paceibacterota bacterium]